jgi:crossover junction endodeoxyribonuclease RusA
MNPADGAGSLDCTLGQPVPVLEVFVPGRPAPQGSKSPKGRAGNGRIIMAESSKHVGPWRADIKVFAQNAYSGPLLEGQPLRVTLEFVMPRPVGMAKTKATPPHIKMPDVDKLTRAVHDALAGIVYANDSAIVSSRPDKRYAELGEQPGVHITVQVLS